MEVEKIKVALIVPTLSTGGAEKLVFDIASNIDKKKYSVTIVSLYPKKETYKEQILMKSGIEIIYLNKKKGLSIPCFLRMLYTIKTINPDVIHSHLDTIIYLLPCYRSNQVKLHTVHSMAQFEATGLQKIIRKLAFTFFNVKPVAIGTTVATSISKYYRIALKDISCVSNGVILPEHDTRSTTHNNSMITFITVGTLYYIKNHELLLRAFKNCVEQMNVPIRLKIVGQGELRAQLEKLSADLEIREQVEFLGWTDSVYPELNDADVYVCTSLIEGISLSIIEAMANGLPIIASNVGGNSELVIDGVNGMLFKSKDILDLTRCMLKMIEDAPLRIKQGKNSKDLSKKYDIKRCVKEYESFYSSLSRTKEERKSLDGYDLYQN